jgi:hypothetical protein
MKRKDRVKRIPTIIKEVENLVRGDGRFQHIELFQIQITKTRFQIRESATGEGEGRDNENREQEEKEGAYSSEG